MIATILINDAIDEYTTKHGAKPEALCVSENLLYDLAKEETFRALKEGIELEWFYIVEYRGVKIYVDPDLLYSTIKCCGNGKVVTIKPKSITD